MNHKIFIIVKKYRNNIPWTIGILSFFFGLFIVISSCKQTPDSIVLSGEEMYLSHCQMCHGDVADGHGPMANLLKVEPPDLRLIAERREGRFDRDEIHRIIDGTRKLETGHGDSEMPIWGVVFANEDDIGAAGTSDKIDELVAYLETLQLEKMN